MWEIPVISKSASTNSNQQKKNGLIIGAWDALDFQIMIVCQQEKVKMKLKSLLIVGGNRDNGCSDLQLGLILFLVLWFSSFTYFVSGKTFRCSLVSWTLTFGYCKLLKNVLLLWSSISSNLFKFLITFSMEFILLLGYCFIKEISSGISYNLTDPESPQCYFCEMLCEYKLLLSKRKHDICIWGWMKVSDLNEDGSCRQELVFMSTA